MPKPCHNKTKQNRNKRRREYFQNKETLVLIWIKKSIIYTPQNTVFFLDDQVEICQQKHVDHNKRTIPL